MKTNICFTIVFVFACAASAFSQVQEIIRAPQTGVTRSATHPNNGYVDYTAPRAFVDPAIVSAQQHWGVTLTQRGVQHGSDIPLSRYDSIKFEGQLRKQRPTSWSSYPAQTIPFSPEALPQVNRGFQGNPFNGWAPTDNSIAVSDAGHIVSVVNSSIMMTDPAGNITRHQLMQDFMAVLELTGLYFDPKVLYDPIEDKFILVVLNGNTPANTTIAVGFSVSSDPNEGWWLYTFDGDPTGSNLWFDFPSIGVSTDDLYISGNLYTENRVFTQSIIYQLYKAPGFTGGNVDGVQFHDVADAYGQSDFNVMPVSFGFDGSIGPGIYFISTDASGGTQAMLYYTDGNSQQNPNLEVFSVALPNYYMPYDGYMAGTNDGIKTNDCRVLTGYYAEGTLHFAFNTRGDELHTKVNYCRLNTEDLSEQTVSIGLQPYEYGFPAIAPFSESVNDKTTVIGFLRTSGLTYPEFCVMTCDNDMQYSPAVIVKGGESFTNFSEGTLERWGDYTGMARRHLDHGIEVWTAGSFGNDFDQGQANVLSTWIAQISDELTATEQPGNVVDEYVVFPNPSPDGHVAISFDTDKACELQFRLFDANGILVKDLLRCWVKAGSNQLSFNSATLVPGMYYIAIINENNHLIKSENIVIGQ